MAAWGIDSLKVDGCNSMPATMNMTYPKLGRMLVAAAKKKATPSPTWFSCSWPDYVGDMLCNHSRLEPCVPLQAIAKSCNSARMYDDISDSWNQPSGNGCGVVQIIEFWSKNPQLATLRNGLSRSEAQVQQGMWALWAAPMVLSVELRNKSLAAEMKEILLNKDVLAVADDALGRQATQCKSAGCKSGGILYGGTTSIWNKTLADGSVAVGLVNTGNFGNQGKAFGDFNTSFTFDAVGLGCESAEVKDLWSGSSATESGGVWREVDESSMVMLVLTCK